jgi:hypothetical protein
MWIFILWNLESGAETHFMRMLQNSAAQKWCGAHKNLCNCGNTFNAHKDFLFIATLLQCKQKRL